MLTSADPPLAVGEYLAEVPCLSCNSLGPRCPTMEL